MIESCECGHWYNTKIKCPECDTTAKEEMKPKQLRNIDRRVGANCYDINDVKSACEWLKQDLRLDNPQWCNEKHKYNDSRIEQAFEDCYKEE